MLRFILALLAALGMASVVGVGACFVSLLWGNEWWLMLSLAIGVIGGVVVFFMIWTATAPSNTSASRHTRIGKLNQRDKEE